MSLGVIRICRLRRLGPGVHSGSSSRGQSFLYHLCPTKRTVSQLQGDCKDGHLPHDTLHPASKALKLFLVTSVYTILSLWDEANNPAAQSPLE